MSVIDALKLASVAIDGGVAFLEREGTNASTQFAKQLNRLGYLDSATATLVEDHSFLGVAGFGIGLLAVAALATPVGAEAEAIGAAATTLAAASVNALFAEAGFALTGSAAAAEIASASQLVTAVATATINYFVAEGVAALTELAYAAGTQIGNYASRIIDMAPSVYNGTETTTSITLPSNITSWNIPSGSVSYTEYNTDFRPNGTIITVTNGVTGDVTAVVTRNGLTAAKLDYGTISGVATVTINGGKIDPIVDLPPYIEQLDDGSIVIGLPDANGNGAILVNETPDSIITVENGDEGSVNGESLLTFDASDFSGDEIDVTNITAETMRISIDISAGDTFELSEDSFISGISYDFEFAGADATLKLDAPFNFTGTILNFDISDMLDLKNVSGSSSFSLASGNILEIESSAGNFSLNLDPNQNFAPYNFVLSSDGTGGTDITLKAKPGIYVVQAGDTLASIASHYNISTQTLENLNAPFADSSLSTGAGVSVGDVIYVPINSTSLLIDNLELNEPLALLPAGQAYILDPATSTLYTTGSNLNGSDDGALIVSTPYGNGDYATFQAGTYQEVNLKADGNVNVDLAAGAGGFIGALTFNPSTGAASVSLPRQGPSYSPNAYIFSGLTIALPNGVVPQLINTGGTPTELLASYLTQLGSPVTAQQLDERNISTLAGAAPATTYVVNGTNFQGAVYYSLPYQAGAIISGQTVLPEQNILGVRSYIQSSLLQDTISNIQILEASDSSILLTAAQFAEFASFEGSGTLVLATGGTVDFSHNDITGSNFDLVATDLIGTTLIGNDQNHQSLVASSIGNDMLIAGEGLGDALVAANGDDTLIGGNGGDIFELGTGIDRVQGGTGDDTFYLNFAAAPGSSIIGGGGNDILTEGGYQQSSNVPNIYLTMGSDVSFIDLTDVTISNVQTLNVNVILTATQLAEFSKIESTVEIADTGANILSHLSVLEANRDSIVGVTATDAPLDASVSDFQTYASVVTLITNGFDITDTAANIEAGLESLSQYMAENYGSDDKLSSIKATDSSITVSVAEFDQYQTALDKITGGFVVSDTAANITAALGQLEADSAKIDSISFTDPGTAQISLTANEQAADASVIGKFTGIYTIDNPSPGGTEGSGTSPPGITLPMNVTAEANGNFMVAYVANTQSGSQLLGQQIDAHGVPIGTPQPLALPSGQIAQNASGAGIIVYQSGSYSNGVYQSQLSEITLNADLTAYGSPSVIYNGNVNSVNVFPEQDGTFQIFWTTSSQTGTASYEQTVNAQGQPAGAVQQLNLPYGVIGENTAGQPILVYETYQSSGANNVLTGSVYVQPLTADFSVQGAPTKIFTGNPSSILSPANIVSDPNGDFHVFWTPDAAQTSGNTIYYEQDINAEGLPTGSVQQYTLPSGGVIAENSDGSMVFIDSTFDYSPSSGFSNVQINAESLGPPCYCPGTLIMTETGDVPVEELRIGDRVQTLFNGWQPIKWIGQRSYAERFVRGRPDILPVCILAEAFAPSIPSRDLWVSPRHALYFPYHGEGVLIEASDLVNDRTIFRADAAEGDVQYFHIEVEHHDVLTADGALAESFFDDDSRGIFHNAHEYYELHGSEVRPQQYCAPRHGDGLVVEDIRQAIANRAISGEVSQLLVPLIDGQTVAAAGFEGSNVELCGHVSRTKSPERPADQPSASQRQHLAAGAL